MQKRQVWKQLAAAAAAAGFSSRAGREHTCRACTSSVFPDAISCRRTSEAGGHQKGIRRRRGSSECRLHRAACRCTTSTISSGSRQQCARRFPRTGRHLKVGVSLLRAAWGHSRSLCTPQKLNSTWRDRRTLRGAQHSAALFKSAAVARCHCPAGGSWGASQAPCAVGKPGSWCTAVHCATLQPVVGGHLRSKSSPFFGHRPRGSRFEQTPECAPNSVAPSPCPPAVPVWPQFSCLYALASAPSAEVGGQFVYLQPCCRGGVRRPISQGARWAAATGLGCTEFVAATIKRCLSRYQQSAGGQSRGCAMVCAEGAGRGGPPPHDPSQTLFSQGFPSGW